MSLYRLQQCLSQTGRAISLKKLEEQLNKMKEKEKKRINCWTVHIIHYRLIGLRTYIIVIFHFKPTNLTTKEIKCRYNVIQ